MIKRIALKTGIVLVVLLLTLVAASGIAHLFFQQHVKQEVESLFHQVQHYDELVTQEHLEGLPKNVQAWLEYSGIVGREKISAVRLKQTASMRLGKDQSWLPVEAEQYFASEKPGFIWRARVQAAPFIHIAARDKYDHGHGNMLIKPLSLITLSDAKGAEIDQGTMLRYLAETMWFPSAALEDYIVWETIDDTHAKATMTYEDVQASGIFTFNSDGAAVKFEAERYGEFNGAFRLHTWAVPVSDYRSFDGMMVPTKGEVTWKLPEGDFNWFRFEVIEMEYNQPAPY
ncbi:DUF6544 family protein [Anoxynatronum buryatiense]|uniref:Uncharacterized protein n=1 Tax=Anoxynatronum buryatiense TaxID=489973 RepID=A0AA45WVV7_9CLOT|nr:DUF6544 family protein [Anoxynatronum buryatiense]SMP54296.1 hypothetical protein SAMN06296020_105109 [Anoxynatronum buryatiense]